MPYNIALLAALGIFGLYFVFYSIIAKKTLPYTAWLLSIVFILTIVLSIATPFRVLYADHASIVFELLLLVVFFIFTQVQHFFRIQLIQRTSDDNIETTMLRFNADLQVIRTTMLLLILHLLIVLLYLLFSTQYPATAMSQTISFYVLFGLFAFFYAYEGVRWKLMQKQVRAEEWLPIVDEEGTVYGKVTLSSSLTNPTYLHPMIRIALVHNGMLFLRPQTESLFPLENHRLDQPFERYLRFGEMLEVGIRETLMEYDMPANTPIRFLSRYFHQKTNRLVYLYVCYMTDEKELSSLDLSDGKWWTGKQIGENLGTGIFTDYFEKEYATLKETMPVSAIEPL
ncbi:hypothetical protein FACS1894162_4880 [Bacteroidia bacterium]|nr:hypothetical protein FACS1894162_4880 [Bacteroidia bacterium]